MKEWTCPVCKMLVTTPSKSVMHHGIQYVFCTKQCLQNFEARPILYLRPEKRKRVLKKRTFSFEQKLTAVNQKNIMASLLTMMGIRAVRIEENYLSITYDLLEATALQVEHRLEEEGARLGSGWASQFKRGWINYSEENLLNNLAEPDAACCNKPPRKG